MLRITELKLPIDHPEEDLRPAIVQRLGIASDDLLDFTLFKRSYDARKKSSELCFIYTIDLERQATRPPCCSSSPMIVTSTRRRMSATKWSAEHRTT